MFGPKGLAFLRELELRAPSRRRLDSTLRLIADCDPEINEATREIEALAKADERAPILTQIRDIGRYTAMLVIAEVGDVHRFGSARKLCAWAGLTPTVRASDQRARLGHITKQGSRPLRWALVESAQMAVTGGGRLRSDFEPIAKRRGRKIAKVAIARKLLTLCCYGLRDGEIRCLSARGRPDARDGVMAVPS
jgi:transposase